MIIIEDLNPIKFFEEFDEKEFDKISEEFFADNYKNHYDIFIEDRLNGTVKKGMVDYDDFGNPFESTQTFYLKTLFIERLDKEYKKTLGTINSYRLQASNQEQANHFTSELIIRLKKLAISIRQGDFISEFKLLFLEKVESLIDDIQIESYKSSNVFSPIFLDVKRDTIKLLYRFLCEIGFLEEGTENQEQIFNTYFTNPACTSKKIIVIMKVKVAALVFNLIKQELIAELTFNRIENDSVFLNRLSKPFKQLSKHLSDVKKSSDYDDLKYEIESIFSKYFPKR